MRLKFLTVLMVFIALILTLSSVMFYYYFKNNLTQGMELMLSDSADRILVEIADDPDRFIKEPGALLFSATPSEFTSSVVLVQFMDDNGDLLAKSPALKRNSLPFLKDADSILRDIELSDGSDIKVYQRKMEFGGRNLGYIIVGTPASQLYHSLNVLRDVLALVMVCILLILAFGINALASLNMMRDQKRFLGFISHELRTPLSIISGNAEVALRMKPSAKGYKETLSEIKEESDWMNRLVSNLLLIFRGEAGVERISKTAFNLGELIMETASLIKKKYPKKKIKLTLSTKADILADHDRIKQVLMNILENAAKYTGENGNIGIRLYSNNKQFVMVISDDGIGISRALQKKIFDPYYRVEQTKSEGMGLGLAISKWIIGSHRGRIEVKSEPSKGSTFTVFLPKK